MQDGFVWSEKNLPTRLTTVVEPPKAQFSKFPVIANNYFNIIRPNKPTRRVVQVRQTRNDWENM